VHIKKCTFRPPRAVHTHTHTHTHTHIHTRTHTRTARYHCLQELWFTLKLPEVVHTRTLHVIITCRSYSPPSSHLESFSHTTRDHCLQELHRCVSQDDPAHIHTYKPSKRIPAHGRCHLLQLMWQYTPSPIPLLTNIKHTHTLTHTRIYTPVLSLCVQCPKRQLLQYQQSFLHAPFHLVRRTAAWPGQTPAAPLAA